MENIYIFNYNNYYNRIFKRNIPQEITDYPEELYCEAVSNFNPNDGITAEVIINYTGNPNPDYCVVTDEDDEILSRWFVMEVVRTRAHQYRMILKRDVIADNYDDIITGKAFVEKGIIDITNPKQNPLLYNQENINTNQILVGRGMITDKTKTPWLIMYIDADHDSTTTINSCSVTKTSYATDITYADISDYLTTKTVLGTPTGNGKNFINILGRKVYTYYDNELSYFNSIIESDTKNSSTITSTTNGPRLLSDTHYWKIVPNEGHPITGWAINDFLKIKFQNLRSTSFWSSLYTNYFGSNGDTTYLDFKNQFEGKVLSRVVDGVTNYYRINLVIDRYGSKHLTLNNSGSLSSVYQTLKICLEGSDLTTPINKFEANGSLSDVDISIPYVDFHVSLQLLPSNKIQISNPNGFTTISPVNDNTFIMLAAPYSQETLAYFSKLQTSLGAYCYDTQILPFLPMQNIIDEDGDLVLTDLTLTSDYSYLDVLDENNAVITRYVLLVCKESIFSLNGEFTPEENLMDYAFNHYYPNVTSNISAYRSAAYNRLMNLNEDNPILKKADYLTRKFRLAAPNGSSYFDFSKEMNGNITTQFNIDCAYKPINPYIRISPFFSDFYGPIQNDYRGIIFNGDFSIAKIDSAWVSYENQNKNYENIFNREIKSMELNQSVAREQERWSIATGALTATVGGATAGFLMSGGNPVGLLAGAATSGGLSLAGGLRDYQLNEKLRDEALDYKHDLFGFNIGSIKAMPNTITKTGVLSNNNPLFPYLEVYACSEGEYDAVVNKLLYNSMTIGTIGKINDYTQNLNISFTVNSSGNNFTTSNLDKMYFKCKLIHIDINDDTHMVQEISNELDKGVFIKWE